MRITVLGTGHMATTLGSAFVKAGHTVTFGSRDPSAHTDLPGPVLESATSVTGADLVVSALQASFSLDTLSALAGELAGHILLDIGNAVTPRFELMYPNESLGAKLQEALPNTRVVKSLNTLAGTTAVAPDTLPEATTVFLSGDDAEAKEVVSGLLGDLGWPKSTQVDLGDITSARGPEHYFLLFAAMMQKFGGGAFNVAVVR